MSTLGLVSNMLACTVEPSRIAIDVQGTVLGFGRLITEIRGTRVLQRWGVSRGIWGVDVGLPEISYKMGCTVFFTGSYLIWDEGNE